jgi:WD40 repeat protein
VETVRRQRATNRRLQVLLVGVVAALVVAVIAGAFAARQSGVARDQSLAADARRAGAKALTIQDPVRSVLLAAAGARLDPGPQTLMSLEAALMQRPELVASRPVAAGALLSRIAQSATTGSVYVADRTFVLRRFDADSLAMGATYSATSAPATVEDNPVAVSEETGVVAYARRPIATSPIVLLDSKTLVPVPDQITSFPKRDVVVASLSVSGDGRFLSATLGHPKVVGPNEVEPTSAEARVWDLTLPGRPVVASFPLDGTFGAGRLNHDGSVLFTTSPAQARDVRSGRVVWAYRDGGFAGDVLVRPQGDLIALSEPSADHDVILVDARNGRLVARLSGHSDHIYGLAMSSNGSLIAAGGYDGRVLVWDVDTRQLVADIDAGGKRVPGVALSPDGRTLWTATADPPEVRAWDLAGDRQYLQRLPEIADATAHLTGEEVFVDVDRSGVQASSIQRRDPTEPDARGATGSRIDLWFTDSDRQTFVTAAVEPGAWEGAGAWSPDGQRFAVGYAKGLVSVVDAMDGHSVVVRGSGLPGTILSLSYDHRGAYLVATDDRGHVARLDATTLKPRGPVITLPGRSVRGVVMEDGRRAVVTADLGEPAAFWRMPVRTWFLVDLEAGNVVRKGGTGADEVESVAVSPDGTRAAFGGRRGDVAIIELATGLPVRTAVRVVGDGVFNVRFSADGAQLAAGSTSGEAVLLDGSSGLVLARTRAGESFGTTGVGFRTDRSLLIVSGGQSRHVWSRSTTRALDFACALVGRDLTPEEWAEEFPGREKQPICQ